MCVSCWEKIHILNALVLSKHSLLERVIPGKVGKLSYPTYTPQTCN